MNQLYRVVGISKQAVYKYAKSQEIYHNKIEVLMLETDILRKEHAGCGVEKIYLTLKPDFLGRDRFIDLFMELGYRLKRKKNYRKTTISSKLYYPNLIKGMELNSPYMVWQSDITYIEVSRKFYYSVFILDVYTKIIVGYNVSDNMRASSNIKALKMSFKNHKPPSIHHSDRGSQYTSKDYIKLLLHTEIQVSMGLIAQDNAYAERVNRTIKEEYLDHWKPETFLQLKNHIKKAVNNYNTKRIHNGFRPLKMSPVEFEKYVLNLPKQNRPMETIYTDDESEFKTREASNLSRFKQNKTSES